MDRPPECGQGVTAPRRSAGQQRDLDGLPLRLLSRQSR